MLCLLIAFGLKAQQLNTFTIRDESKKCGNNLIRKQLKNLLALPKLSLM